MQQENDIMKRIQVALTRLSAGALVTFRNNTGTGWTGNEIDKGKAGAVIIRDARPLYAGLCKGSADLIGWRSLVITPEMVGRRVAVFVAIEVKKPGGRLSKEQRHFLESAWKAGAIAGVARSEAEAEHIAADFTGRGT